MYEEISKSKKEFDENNLRKSKKYPRRNLEVQTAPVTPIPYL